MRWLFSVIFMLVFMAHSHGQVPEDTVADHFKFSLDSINKAPQRHQDWLNSLLFESKIMRLLDSALAQLEKPYAYGAKGPDRYDCSGFTRYIYRHLGIRLPASSVLQAGVGTPVEMDQLRPGDLVFFRGRAKSVDRIGHVGIVVQISDVAIEFIHTSTSRGVTIDDLMKSAYYATRYMTGRRILE